MQDIISKIKQVGKGDKIKDALTAEWMNGVRKAILALCNGQHIRTGPNVLKHEHGSSCSIDVMIPDEPFIQQEYNPLPFEVMIVKIAYQEPTDNTQYLGVNFDSHLIDVGDSSSYESDNSGWGILNSDYVDSGASSGNYIDPDDLGVGDKIWLELAMDSGGSLTGVNLGYGTAGGSDWDVFPDPISINDTDDPSNPYQDKYYQIIAEVTDPEEDSRDGLQVTNSSGTFQIVQILTTNIVLVSAQTSQDADYPGVPIMVTIPWNAPVTSLTGEGSADTTDTKTPWDFGGGSIKQNYALVDASSGGVAYFQVLNGNHKEVATGITWIPDNINTPIAAAGYTLAYFTATIGSTTQAQAMSALTIKAGTAVPADDSTHWYQLIGNFTVASGKVTVPNPQGGVSGSQMYQYCGGAQCWLQ